jgi:tetratricopeptide (TPR) repeat protein
LSDNLICLSEALSLHRRGRVAEATRMYSEILKSDSSNADALHLLGLATYQDGRLSEALELVFRAIETRPDAALFYFNAANILRDLNRLEDACRFFRASILLRSDNVDAYVGLGATLAMLGQHHEAIEQIEAALAVQPAHAEAWFNLGNSYKAVRMFDKALFSYDRAVHFRAHFPQAYNNSGTLLREIGRFDDAVDRLKSAVGLEPDYVYAWNNLGLAILDSGDPSQAMSCFRRALALDGDFANAKWNAALAALVLGQYSIGWPLFESRWQKDGGRWPKRWPTDTLWRGHENVNGRTVVLWSEQGLGDTIQFVRFAMKLHAIGATVNLVVPAPLVSIMRSVKGVQNVFEEGHPLSPFDLHCPFMSLPLRFGTVLESIPWDGPYLRPDDSKVKVWRDRLSQSNRIKVGFVWNGGYREHQPELWGVNERRNILLESMASALQQPQIDFYSLQKGEPAESQLRGQVLSYWPQGNGYDFTESLKDFSDTAALIECMDFVVSVDTSTAHLSAAMGKPTWLLNRFDTCWRWMLSRSDSPWYPTMKVYRQPRPGDWKSVLQQVSSDLAALKR